ncbi:MAG TPA: nuclease-related domain-containing protein [Acidimicrobiales bacterium]|nr:nuclease-related domain-containing protein [Acidimicrobiales bacterium]
MAWYDPDIKKVVCVGCRPAPPSRLVNPVGGASAQRRATRTRDPNWQKGAVGEHIIGEFLQRTLTAGEIIANDRQVPGGRGNIDHLVVASSGVWLIDTKHWTGTIEYKNTAGLFNDRRRLFVNGVDRTAEIEAAYQSLIPVKQLIADPSVPVHPALVFVDGDWTLGTTLKLLAGRPHQHLGVWITAPKALARKIREPGPLSGAKVRSLAAMLDAHLPPMGQPSWR